MSDRYKVWTFDEKRRLLLRTGSDETLECDAGNVPGYAADIAKLARERTGYAGPLIIKNFDTDTWCSIDENGIVEMIDKDDTATIHRRNYR